MIPLFTHKQYVLEGFLTTCSFDYISRDLVTRYFMIFLIITGFVFPLMIQFIFYKLTYEALNERKKEIRKNIILRENSIKAIIQSSKSVVQDAPKSYDSIINQEYKLTKTVLICVVFFCISWVPYTIITLLAQFGSNIENYVTSYTTSIPALFAKTSSVYNPLIFMYKNKECRKYVQTKINMFFNKNHNQKISIAKANYLEFKSKIQ